MFTLFKCLLCLNVYFFRMFTLFECLRQSCIISPVMFIRRYSIEEFLVFHSSNIYFYYLLLLFTQGSLFSAYYTVINECPAIEVLIVSKAPI